MIGHACRVRDIGNEIISPVVALQFEENAKTPWVNVVYIGHVKGELIQAKLKSRGNGKYKKSYRLIDVPANPSRIKVSYRIKFDTANNRVVVRGLVPGVANSIAGKGQYQKGRLTKN